ncbi:hypothetical protein HMSSN139_63170 [Paenibacillus sp. HMSSN-139]|nr:hypothetical protein HMSSN139_63170 [Paenibacillus sp. HMSSN-139]
MKWVLITAAALVLLWLIVLPLAVVLTEALKKGWDVYVAAIRDPDALSALRLTLLVALITVPLNTILGWPPLGPSPNSNFAANRC